MATPISGSAGGGGPSAATSTAGGVNVGGFNVPAWSAAGSFDPMVVAIVTTAVVVGLYLLMKK